MTTKLRLYNRALRNLGESRLAAVDDEVEARYLLDTAYDDGAIDFALAQGYWNFAIRSQHISYDSGISPDFGFQRAIDKPSDWISTVMISGNEYYDPPLLAFHDEGAYWYCDLDSIYVRFVSNDASYGGDLTLWTESFANFFSWYLAKQIYKQLTGAKVDTEEVKKGYKEARTLARANDAMQEGVKFPPRGSWPASRGNRQSHRDLGNTGSLTG